MNAIMIKVWNGGIMSDICFKNFDNNELLNICLVKKPLIHTL